MVMHRVRVGLIMLTEVVVCYVEVFCAWVDLQHAGHFSGPTISTVEIQTKVQAPALCNKSGSQVVL